MGEGNREQPKVSLGARVRRAALFVLFSAVLLIPKTLALRRRRGLWNGLRLAAAGAGLTLFWLGWSGGLGAWSLVGGVALVLVALFVPAARAGKSVDEQARELGALVVVNGGRHQRKPVRLYVAAERVDVLDFAHQPMLTIPLAAVLRVEAEAEEGWRLRVEWEGGEAVFVYDGVFAEHLARVAETTLRSQLRRELPVLK